MTRSFLCHSQRSLTKQHHSRCSKCLKRSTKSCMRGEAVELGFSRDCRMSVNSGPLASLIFGILPTVFYQSFDFFSFNIYCRCVSGLWGLRWCVPVMRASSGTLLQTRAAWRTCQQPKGAVHGAHRKTRALESKLQCALI